jgi:hypothetical protein
MSQAIIRSRALQLPVVAQALLMLNQRKQSKMSQKVRWLRTPSIFTVDHA